MTSKAFEQYTDEDLAAELERRKKAIDAHPPMIGNFNWNPLLDMLDYNAKQSIKQGFEDEDFPHYVYEEVLKAVYGKDYFGWKNKQKWPT